FFSIYRVLLAALRALLSFPTRRSSDLGCIYCFARPTHSYLGLSPGLDFETRLYAKVNAAELLRRELASASYIADAIALGVNTDRSEEHTSELQSRENIVCRLLLEKI